MFKALTLDLALETFVGVDLTREEQDEVNKAFIAAVRAGTSIIRKPVPGTSVGQGPEGAGLPRGLLPLAPAGQATRRRRRPVRPAVPRAERGRPRVQRRRHRQPHDLPADGRARHDDHHDELDGLPPGQEPRVAGEGARRVGGGRRPRLRRRARARGARPGDEGVDAAVLAGALAPPGGGARHRDRRLPHPGRLVRDRVAVHEPLPARALARPDALRPRPVRARPARGPLAPAGVRAVRRRRAQVHRDALRRDAGARDLPRAAAQLPLVGARPTTSGRST